MAEKIRSVYFNRSPLVLTKDRSLITDQLNNLVIVNPLTAKLTDGIDTDVIIPPDPCKSPDPQILAEYALTGWQHIDQGSLKKHYPNVLVAGDHLGSGSSREHAVLALTDSGCGIVICKSAAPMFLRNAINNGLYISHDFSLLDDISKGKPIPLERLTTGLDPLSRTIVSEGGLLNYLDSGKSPDPILTTQRPQTIAEKWLAQYLEVPYVQPGDGGLARPDKAYTYEYMLPLSLELLRRHRHFTQQSGQDLEVFDPQQLIFFNDHLALDNDPRSSALQQIVREVAARYGIELYDTNGQVKSTPAGPVAICHIKMADSVTPGFYAGTDSHASMTAPFAGYVVTIGATDYAGVMLTGKAVVVVPETVRINLHNKFLPYVTANDLMLSLIAQDAKGKNFSGNVMEFGGPALPDLNVLDLVVIAHRTAEARAVTGVFEPHLGVANHLVRTERAPSVDAALDMYQRPDENAIYTHQIDIDLREIGPTVATPGSPDRGKPLNEIAGKKINKVIIGSCVGGTIEDIRIAAAVLHGRRVNPDVRLFVQPHSRGAYNYALNMGWIADIHNAGGIVVEGIGCGACIGQGPGTLEATDTCITSASRNHTSRMGHPDAQVYLANTAVSTVAGILGEIPALQQLIELTRQVPWGENVTLLT